MGQVLDAYARRYPRMKEMAGSILVARNREFTDLSAGLEEGDEVALLPPVSGGMGAAPLEEAGNYFALTRVAIEVRRVMARMLTGAEGGVVTFEGTARNNTNGRPTRYLDYECYEPMALKMMKRIGEELTGQPEIQRVAIVHRLGRILIGETSVAIIVTAAHRRPAFAAALEAIDRLKKTVPIWKRECFEDGEVWAEGDWDADLARRA